MKVLIILIQNLPQIKTLRDLKKRIARFCRRKIKKCKKEDSRKVLYTFLVGKNTVNEIMTAINNNDFDLIVLSTNIILILGFDH